MIQDRYAHLKTFAGTILMCLLLAMGSCTDKFEDFNSDPNRATDDDVKKDMLALGGMFPSMMLDIIPVSDRDANEYQRAINLTGDIFSGYMAAIGQWNGGSNNSTYDLTFSDWNDVAFKVAYRTMGYWKQVQTKSVEYTSPTAYSLAQILKVMALHRITDNYGPIPYSKMGQGALGSPYDSQEEVYKGFFNDLNEAISDLKAFLNVNPKAMPLKKYDLIYGGDFRKWIVFANSLKLRLAMRMVYVEPELAKQYAEEAVNDEYGVMKSNEQNALLKSALGIKVFNPLWVCWDRYGDTRMGASMESFLKGYEDPRMEVYFSPSTLRGNGYYGVRNGVIIEGRNRYMRASSPNVSNDSEISPIMWMCAAEIYFLRAEGALRGWNMGGEAEDLYNDGIATSFLHRGISAGEAISYIDDDSAVPADYTDVFGSSSISAVADTKIKWEGFESFERRLEQIMTQKWLALFPDGQEAWTEFRRTGYPKIFPIVENKGNIDTKVQIRRITFPQSEYRANGEEVAKAITLLGGPDDGGTKLWWDKK